MDTGEANRIIHEEARRSFDISIDTIRAYDGRVHQIVILTTTSIGILFVITGFLTIDFFTEILKKFASFPNLSPLEVGCIFAFFGSIVSFFIALIFCLKAYTTSKFRVLNPKYIKEGYDSLLNKNDFMNELIYQIGDVFEINKEILHKLYRHYTNSISCLAIGWTLLAIFVILSMIISAI